VARVSEVVAIVAITEDGAKLGRRIARALPGAELHGRAGRVTKADTAFAETTAHLRSLFRRNVPIVGICAAGILVRALAPLLRDKSDEPPVIAVSADGKSVVPILGGHRGANRLAAQIAKSIGGRAAITTAGDTALGIALDDPPPGWRVGNAKSAKPIAAALLAGKRIAVEIEHGLAAPWIESLRKAASGAHRRGSGVICVTSRAAEHDHTLYIYPPVLALGVGCERGTSPRELIALAHRALKKAGLAPEAVGCVVSLDLKADEPAVHELAAALGVPARFFAPAELEKQRARLANPSEIVFRETGTHGVAEGAALAAVGRKGKLAVAKQKSKRATCAIGWSPTPLDPGRIGRARGILRVVGIGPGAAEWRTPEAGHAVASADHLVGYGPYLDLLGDAARGKTRHRGTLGAEEARVRTALDLAGAGQSVALICSGDAGIYALATLVLELMEREGRADWNRIDLAIAPGISALQAAAARAGAPLGHDFCAISLSDLLTPWSAIETRLRAAAAGDFVVALYNPASQRRRDHLVTALDILRAARPAATPVVAARNLGRTGEAVAVTTLADLDPASVDMLTILLIGSSATRIASHGGRAWVHTPRGYAGKGRTS
jgi:cobalt-precorrin 5A hydrolase/precorrin-3B C17-methyltransferase